MYQHRTEAFTSWRWAANEYVAFTLATFACNKTYTKTHIAHCVEQPGLVLKAKRNSTNSTDFGRGRSCKEAFPILTAKWWKRISTEVSRATAYSVAVLGG